MGHKYKNLLIYFPRMCVASVNKLIRYSVTELSSYFG